MLLCKLLMPKYFLCYYHSLCYYKLGNAILDKLDMFLSCRVEKLETFSIDKISSIREGQPQGKGAYMKCPILIPKFVGLQNDLERMHHLDATKFDEVVDFFLISRCFPENPMVPPKSHFLKKSFVALDHKPHFPLR